MNASLMPEGIWITRGTEGAGAVGMIHNIVVASDPRPMREQIDDRYAHGGGWNAFYGFALNPADLSIQYPEDPPYKAMALFRVRNELLVVYPHSWVMVYDLVAKTHEICRMD